MVADGGILIGTAYLREPYGEHTAIYGYKDPDYRGVLAVSPEYLTEMARAAVRLGWQMTAHTAGGGAIDALLDAYEAVNRETPIAGLRFTVTHGNFPNARAIERARPSAWAWPSTASRRGITLTGRPSKMPSGPGRMRDFIPLRSLFDAGVVVAGGSDHMIRFDSRSSHQPLQSILRDVDGNHPADLGRGGVLGPEQAVSTRRGAPYVEWLSFEEKRKGSIEPGKLADLVVISNDLLSLPGRRDQGHRGSGNGGGRKGGLYEPPFVTMSSTTSRMLGGRLMVRLQTLDLRIGVRVPASQPFFRIDS